jgi:L-threonylcarbamoyladenylate synthase
VSVLSRGGLIIYPTDTAYGLGVNAFNIDAIKLLYDVKQRELSKPTHVIVRDWNMIEGLTITNLSAKILNDNFLPGPLTLILKKHDVVPGILTANLPTLGLRIPDNKVTQAISANFSYAYTTPSANMSGGKTPYTINDVKKELDISKIDLILDAGQLPERLPSTLVDVSSQNIKILREGTISTPQILKALKAVHR